MKRISALMVGVALAGLCGSASAFAQDAAGQRGAEASGDEDGGDIVVTARKRSELLQNVPIAVSAITEETAARSGVTGIEAVTFSTPNLQFNREISQGATPFLRGVGSPQASAGGESPVAVYIDDVYIGSPNGNMFEFNNIASVQVLKGPQGTLFGRNATGGVIQVQTKAPSFDPAMEIRAGYGNYDTYSGAVYATAGLGENVAFNIAASGSKQNDGWGRSLVTGREIHKSWDWNVRGKLLFQAGENTEMTLAGDYGKQSSDIGSNATVYPGSVSLSGATFQGHNTQTAGLDFADVKQGGVSLKIDHEASFADLVSITAYRYTKVAFDLDQDLGMAPLVQVGTVVTPTKTFTQELQIVSKPDSPIKWIVGLYYLHTKTGYDPSRSAGVFIVGPYAGVGVTNSVSLFDTQKLNSYSAFGEATVPVLSDTNLTVGLRYTRDVYDLQVDGRVGDDTFTIPDARGAPFAKHDVFPKLTYRAILDHKFTPDIMAYASYSRGFRSGGYQLAFPGTSVAPAAVVKPEVLDAFEVGLKTQFFNGALTLNGAAFYYDYKNMAISFVQPGGNLIENAAAARIKGLDIDFIANPVKGLRISGGIGILDGEYTDFPNGPILLPLTTPTPANCLAPPPQQVAGGNLICSGNLSGRTTIRTPKFTLTLAPSYTFETGIGSFTIGANYYHNSGFFWEVSNRTSQAAYDVINGSLSWKSPSDSFEIRLWGKNLTDKYYAVYSSPTQLNDLLAPAAPRTYGVTATVRF